MYQCRAQQTLGSRRSFHLWPGGSFDALCFARRDWDIAACAVDSGATLAAGSEAAGSGCSMRSPGLLVFRERFTFVGFGTRVRFGFSTIVRSSSRAPARRSGSTLGAGASGAEAVGSSGAALFCFSEGSA